MFSFIKNIFSKGEEVYKEGEFKFYLSLDKSIFIKISITQRTTCNDIIQIYQNEILKKKLEIKEKENNQNGSVNSYRKNSDSEYNLDDHLFLIIQNNNSNTFLKLKRSQKPIEYLKGLGSGQGHGQGQGLNNLFLIHKDQLVINDERDIQKPNEEDAENLISKNEPKFDILSLMILLFFTRK
jgi:hypothetical protein